MLERIRISGLWIRSLKMWGIYGASERDRTSDLLITNHARYGYNCRRDNTLADYFRISCPRFVHFDLNWNDRPDGRFTGTGAESAFGGSSDF